MILLTAERKKNLEQQFFFFLLRIKLPSINKNKHFRGVELFVYWYDVVGITLNISGVNTTK